MLIFNEKMGFGHKSETDGRYNHSLNCSNIGGFRQFFSYSSLLLYVYLLESPHPNWPFPTFRAFRSLLPSYGVWPNSIKLN